MKTIIRFICVFLCLQCSILSYSQNSSTGTEFWLGFYENWDNSNVELSLRITSEVANSGVVSIPGTGWSQNFTVPANGTVVVIIPNPSVNSVSISNTVLNNAIKVVSNNPVSVYAGNIVSLSSDITLVLPNHLLGDSYIVTAYQGEYNVFAPSQFIVVGTQDNTRIEIIPSCDVLNGVTANTPFTITLNQGQVYLVRGEDLTGSIVRAVNNGNCNNFAVFAGARCSYVPLDCLNCDHLYEQMIPLSAWGKKFITTPLMTRIGGDIYRIVASENGTIVNIDNGSNINLNIGEFYEVLLENASYIISNKPISVAQYSRGMYCDNTDGDPFMIILSPIEQAIDKVIFNIFRTTNINSFFVNIVSETIHTNSVALDGNPLSGWTVVASNPMYSYVRQPITQGTHKINSPNGSISILYAFGYIESYGYLGGININPINTSFDVIVGEEIIPYDVSSNILICFQGSIGVQTNSAGISNILWNFGDGTALVSGNNLVHTYQDVGTYDVTMSFTRNCSTTRESISTTIVVINSNLTLEIEDTIVCNGSHFSYNGDSDYSYLWQDGSTSFDYTFMESGNYSLTITDSFGCSVSNSFRVDFVSLELNSTIQPSCNEENNGSIRINPIGTSSNFGYLWNTYPPQTIQIITNLSAGNYIVTVTDSYGCKEVLEIELENSPPFAVEISSINNLQCYNGNGSVSIDVEGTTSPYSISWSLDDIVGFSPDNLSVGDYSFSVTDVNNCLLSGNFSITGPPEIRYVSNTNLFNCYDGIATSTITITGGVPPYTILWQDGSTSITNANIPVNTDFGYTITDGSGCNVTDIISYEAPPKLEIISTINNIKCKGFSDGSISISVTGGLPPYSIIWDDNSVATSLVNLSLGNYGVTVTDANNCNTSKVFTVTEPVNTISLAINKKDVSCNGLKNGSVFLQVNNGTPPYYYKLYNDYLTYNIQNIDNLIAGTYTAYVKDKNGCEVDTTITINEPLKLIGGHNYINPSCLGKADGAIEIMVSGGSKPYMYYINDKLESDSSYISNLREGDYTIAVIDRNLCKLILGKVSLSDSFVDCIKAPNAFTPNNDGTNDNWVIEGIEEFPEAKIEVYNQWGQEVFNSKDANKMSWNGKFNNKFVPTGSYIYIINLYDDMREHSQYTGVITVVY